ncbi:hypothetical protein GQ42DRAFT_164290 [Ramicandelaber brevisporus]|nr:hypothetical protein GQ42DRAFT_164290 [Ramicandelaber brevisporus]
MDLQQLVHRNLKRIRYYPVTTTTPWLNPDVISVVIYYVDYSVRFPLRLVSRSWYEAYNIYYRYRVIDTILMEPFEIPALSHWENNGYRLRAITIKAEHIIQLLHAYPNLHEMLPNLQFFTCQKPLGNNHRMVLRFIGKFHKLTQVEFHDSEITRSSFWIEFDETIGKLKHIKRLILSGLLMEPDFFPGENLKANSAKHIKQLLLAFNSTEPGEVHEVVRWFPSLTHMYFHRLEDSMAINGIVSLLKEQDEVRELNVQMANASLASNNANGNADGTAGSNENAGAVVIHEQNQQQQTQQVQQAQQAPRTASLADNVNHMMVRLITDVSNPIHSEQFKAAYLRLMDLPRPHMTLDLWFYVGALCTQDPQRMEFERQFLQEVSRRCKPKLYWIRLQNNDPFDESIPWDQFGNGVCVCGKGCQINNPGCLYDPITALFVFGTDVFPWLHRISIDYLPPPFLEDAFLRAMHDARRFPKLRHFDYMMVPKGRDRERVFNFIERIDQTRIEVRWSRYVVYDEDVDE